MAMNPAPIAAILECLPFLKREQLVNDHADLSAMNNSNPYHFDVFELEVNRREEDVKVVIDSSCVWHFQKNTDPKQPGQTKINRRIMKGFEIVNEMGTTYVNQTVMEAFEEFMRQVINRRGSTINTVRNFGEVPLWFSTLQSISMASCTTYTPHGSARTHIFPNKGHR